MVAYPHAGYPKAERERFFIFSVKLILSVNLIYYVLLHATVIRNFFQTTEFKRVKNPMMRVLELNQHQCNEKDLDIFDGIKWKTQVKFTFYIHASEKKLSNQALTKFLRKKNELDRPFCKDRPTHKHYIIISKTIPSTGKLYPSLVISGQKAQNLHPIIEQNLCFYFF